MRDHDSRVFGRKASRRAQMDTARFDPTTLIERIVSGVNRAKIVEVTLDALRTRQSLVKGERLVRHEMRAVLVETIARWRRKQNHRCGMRENCSTLYAM